MMGGKCNNDAFMNNYIYAIFYFCNELLSYKKATTKYTRYQDSYLSVKYKARAKRWLA